MDKLRNLVMRLSVLPTGSLIERGNKILYQYYDHGLLPQIDVTGKEYENIRRQIREAKVLEQEVMPQLELLKREDIKTYRLVKTFLKEERRRALAHFITTTKPYPEKHIIYTPHGDFVTSKSELAISMMIDTTSYKYHYEKSLKLAPGIILHPDFTFKINGREYYYEHMGMMDEKKYRENARSRVGLYENHGIHVGDQLFCTYEYGKDLDIVKIRRNLLKFLDSKM